MQRKNLAMIAAGGLAGLVNGLFGGGGGMVLVPLLCLLTTLQEQDIFSSAIAVILPICLVSLAATALAGPIPVRVSLPYLLGSGLGGYAAAKLGHYIPTRWLHRSLGILIIWGGIRYLC